MFKKLLLKTAMYAVVMLGLSAYAGYLMTGHLPAYFSRFTGLLPANQSASGVLSNWSDIGALKHKTTAQEGNYEVMQGGKTVIYKWQDAKGHWQYGERAPQKGVATKMEITTPPPANVASPIESVKTSEQRTTTSNGSELANPYSPEGVKQIMGKAHEVQRMMNERNAELGKE